MADLTRFSVCFFLFFIFISTSCASEDSSEQSRALDEDRTQISTDPSDSDPDHIEIRNQSDTDPEGSDQAPDATSEANDHTSDGLTAPAGLDHAIPRFGYPFGRLCSNLIYEANNISMRGPRSKSGRYQASGKVIAQRWKRAASKMKGVFVLRDALYSQQDHPVKHSIESLMMPPNWVTAAVAAALEEKTIVSVRAPELADDAAWAAIGAPEEMFGSFPPSESLHEWATKSLAKSRGDTKAMIENARKSVRSLANSSESMIKAAKSGPQAVASAGAEEITTSDRRYFGGQLRRDRIIPISVENPNRHEIDDEGKGFEITGRKISAKAFRITRDAVLRRRLRDGDLALERYDLSKQSERRRAIRVLERLIPENRETKNKHLVWLWINGRLDRLGVRGEDASAYIADFRLQVEAANIDTSRLRYVNKPSVILPRKGTAKALKQAAKAMRKLGLPLSVNMNTKKLLRLWGE